MFIIVIFQYLPLSGRIIINVPEDYTTIQNAIVAAEDGDQVIVSPGTYTECINFLGKEITVASLYYTTQDTSYISQTVIDAGNDGRVIEFSSSEDSLSIVCGFSLINGFAGKGAGILCDEASPYIHHVIIEDCAATSQSGGGIYCENNAEPIIDHITIRNNWAYQRGGGLAAWNGGNIVMTNSQVINNAALVFGGGIFCLDTIMRLENVLIKDNISENDGGGIYLHGATTCYMDYVTIDGNVAPGVNSDGGGIYVTHEANIIMNNCIVSNNQSDMGGGMLIKSGSYARLEYVQIMNNLSTGGGGGVYIRSCYIDFEDVDISGNKARCGGGIYSSMTNNSRLRNVNLYNNIAEISGGALHFYNSHLALESVNIYENIADTGSGVYFIDSFPDFSRTDLCNIYNNYTRHHTRFSEISGEYLFDKTEVYLDTFTVMSPTDYQITPLHYFDMMIRNSVIDQVDYDLFVSPQGNNANSGISPLEPLRTINHAVMILSTSSGEPRSINLAPGVYSPSTNGESFPISLPNYTTLKGNDQNMVILDAEQTAGTMYFSHITDCRIEGITISGGYAELGAGVCLDSSSVVFRDLIITSNMATESGGGINCYSQSYPQLYNVTIHNNSSENWGGAITCTEGSSPKIINSTLTDNSAVMGGGIFCAGYAFPVIVNSILWNNTPEQIYSWQDEYSENYITIAYSDIQDRCEGIICNNTGIVNWLGGVIDEDPLFVEPGINYALNMYSPCINSGTDWFEFMGEVLLKLNEDQYTGTNPDMGAWEYNPAEHLHQEDCVIPADSFVMKSYPNPFNPVTNIFFDLPESGRVSVSIYNMKGQLVKTLSDEIYESGKHNLIWNGEDQNGKSCASGVYFIQLSSKMWTAANKIILIK